MSRPMHFEVHAEQPERAARFYEQLFGWTFSRWDGPMEYWNITTGPDGAPGINGGMVRRRGPAPGDQAAVNAFVCTIGVANVDDLVARIPAAGGQIALPKMPVPGIGWLAYARDTEGNLFGFLAPDVSAR
jgi:predicted enzyme related to lactoylglutathione lyase